MSAKWKGKKKKKLRRNYGKKDKTHGSSAPERHTCKESKEPGGGGVLLGRRTWSEPLTKMQPQRQGYRVTVPMSAILGSHLPTTHAASELKREQPSFSIKRRMSLRRVWNA
jgi:hypothetical protein